jgi:cytochrome c oxidase accessory protein FixG
MSVQLPVVDEPASSLRKDGSRNWVHPADVKGRWTRLRRIGFAVLILVYVVLPWIDINGHPAVFLDILHRKFYLFGLTFNAQDAWLAFFLVTGAGFSLIVATALLGRIWCGYACPQTVFLEGVYRRVERWIEGPRNVRLRRNASKMSWDKAWRKALKHLLFALISVFLAHVFLSYFTSLSELFVMVRRAPAEHPEAFAWVTGITVALYVNFAFFREQLCLVVCPYGRLQSVLTDRGSIIVGYDSARGEPRGKIAKAASATERGDCVDCHRCVVVCPTGIDIRNGLQLDCIGCASCIDACDEVMAKLGKPAGLVRYDSLDGLEHKPQRFLRPRLALYAALGAVGLAVASLALSGRQSFEANLMRQRGAPYVVIDEGVRNAFEVHLVNKGGSATTYELRPLGPDAADVAISRPVVEVESLDSEHVPVFVTTPAERFRPGTSVRIEVRTRGGAEEDDGDEHDEDEEQEVRVIEAPLLGPAR